MIVSHRFSVAPMMGRTDRHFRVLVRQLSAQAWLYTEMLTGRAVVEGRAEHDLAFDPVELPLVMQVGDDDPRRLAHCARVAQARGFSAINLNCGCPSPAAAQGEFGARLMLRPEHVAECVAAMRGACSIPVTVKHRIGADTRDRYTDMLRFVDIVARAGARTFIVHARKAWLRGLNPKQNRTVPPLRPGEVQRLARERPELEVVLNGGIADLDATCSALDGAVSGVMVGRAMTRSPMKFAEVDARVYGADRPQVSLADVVVGVWPYLARWVESGGRVHDVTRHLLGFFHGMPGGRLTRQQLSELGADVSLGQAHAVLKSYCGGGGAAPPAPP